VGVVTGDETCVWRHRVRADFYIVGACSRESDVRRVLLSHYSDYSDVVSISRIRVQIGHVLWESPTVEK
jgi:hypothetical protein